MTNHAHIKRRLRTSVLPGQLQDPQEVMEVDHESRHAKRRCVSEQ